MNKRAVKKEPIERQQEFKESVSQNFAELESNLTVVANQVVRLTERQGQMFDQMADQMQLFGEMVITLKDLTAMVKVVVRDQVPEHQPSGTTTPGNVLPFRKPDDDDENE